VLIVAAPLSAMMVLIYARLLGLLAWKIAQLGPLPVDAKAGRCRPGWPASSDAELVPPHIPRPAPRAAPETEPAPGSYIPQSPTGLLELENLVPYKLAGDKGPTKPKQEEQPHKRLRPLDPEEEDAQKPYEMADPPAPNPPLSVEQLLSTLPRSYAAQSAKQKGVSQGLSLGGVIAFPFYETSLGAFVWLSPGSGLFGLLAMQLVSSVPR